MKRFYLEIVPSMVWLKFKKINTYIYPDNEDGSLKGGRLYTTLYIWIFKKCITLSIRKNRKNKQKVCQ